MWFHRILLLLLLFALLFEALGSYYFSVLTSNHQKGSKCS
jgi:hypothetical protein